MDFRFVLISVFAFGAATFLVYGLIQLFQSSRSGTIDDRLKALNGSRPLEQATGLLKDEELAAELEAKLKSFRRVVLSLDDLFVQAGVRPAKLKFLGMCTACGVVGSAVAVVTRTPWPMVPAVAAAVSAGPIAYLLWRRGRRSKAFADQFPDALEMLARALRAGHSLPSAIHVLSTELLPPLAQEFAVVSEALNLGMPVDRALEELDGRVSNPEVRFFTTCVRVQQRTGGNLAEVLDKIGRTVRDRSRMLGQVQALTAEGRLTGVILLSLPWVLFAVVYYLSPGYVAPLFEDPIGKQMVVVTIGLQFVGAAAIKKIVAIKI